MGSSGFEYRFVFAEIFDNKNRQFFYFILLLWGRQLDNFTKGTSFSEKHRLSRFFFNDRVLPRAFHKSTSFSDLALLSSDSKAIAFKSSRFSKGPKLQKVRTGTQEWWK
jgi:hypothetical protein